MEPQQIDLNVQALNAIEASWSLPNLPDMVKFDLAAMAGLDVDAVQGFAYGLAQDMQEVAGGPLSVPRIEIATSMPKPKPAMSVTRGYTGGERLHQFTQGTAGFAAPTRVEGADSVTAWKRRAVSMGYLDEGTSMDTAWDPAFNSVLHEMRNDDYQRRIAGDKPGPSASIMQIAEFFDDWLSPTGLIHAAIEMDFLPDLSKIADEYGEKGFWGAVDDVALPVLNLALLFTGVGEAVLFTRGVMAASKVGLKGWELANGVAKVRKVGVLGRAAGKSANVAEDIARMQRPGLIGARIGAKQTPGRKLVSDQMAAWRELRPVMIGRKTVQQGMRLGLTARVENRFTDYEGHGLPDEWGDKWGDWRHNPAFYLAGEMAFTPLHILQPGQITAPFGFVARFAGIGGDARWGEEAASAVRHNIINPGDLGDDAAEMLHVREAAAKAWDKRVKEVGPNAAVKEKMGFSADDDEGYTSWLTWLVTMAAVDAHAAGSMASGDNVVRGALRFKQDFHTGRNNLISQLRHIDPDNPQELLATLAWQSSKNKQQANAKLKKYNDALFGDDAVGVVDLDLPAGAKGPKQLRRDNLAELIDLHNKNREVVLRNLLEKHSAPGVLANQMGESLGNQGTWDAFVESSQHIDDAFTGGLLDDAKFLQAKSPETGRPLQASGGRVISNKESMFDQPVDSIFTVDIVDVLDDPDFMAIAKHGLFNPLNRKFPKQGRFTVAKTGTPVKQDLLRDYAVFKRLRFLRKTMVSLRRGPVISRQWKEVAERAEVLFTADGYGLKHIRISQLNNIMRNMEIEAFDQKRMRQIVRYMQKQQVDAVGVLKHLDSRLDLLNRSSKWSSMYGIDSTLTLEKKMVELLRRSRYTAAEVDMASIPADVAQSLKDKGYKLVHGVEFAAPNDLKNLHVGISDLVDVRAYQQSWGLVGTPLAKAMQTGKRGVRGLGRSVLRHEPEHITTAYRAALRSSLQRNLIGAVDSTKDYRNTTGEDLSKLMDRLRKIARDISDSNKVQVQAKQDMALFDPRRITTNVNTSFAPSDAVDLVRTKGLWNTTNRELAALGYSEVERLAIFDGLKGARVIGPQLRGRFTNWLDKLQATPALTNTMRLMSRQTVTGGYGRKTGAFTTRNAPVIGLGFAQGRWGADGENKDLGDVAQDVFASVALIATGRAAGGKLVKRLFGSVAATRSARWKKLSYLDPTTMLTRGASHMDDSMRAKHWAYLPDRLATMRDYFRFSLSPIFDMSRYSEGVVLAQMGDLPEEVLARGGLRFNISPTRWRKDRARQLAGGKKSAVGKEHVDKASDEWGQVVAEFAEIGRVRHDFDYEALEAGTARFRQIGILGFNTHEWMASMYADLTRLHNMPKMKAYETARTAFTYGLKPRSAMEMNVNAVFFPFSFMKKTVGHAGRFMMQDWSRAAMIHDSIKTYELLDEKYDLEELWRDHLPILGKLQRLNLFAYGVGAGELGGANRPIIDFFNSTPVGDKTINPILNIFMPQGYDMRTAEDVANIEGLMRRIAPMFNDTQHLIEDAGSQWHVLFGGTGITKEAEAREGFTQVSELTGIVHQFLKDQGVREGITAIGQKRYAPLKEWLDGEKARIRGEFPGYQDALLDVTTNSIVGAQDRRTHTAAFAAFQQAGTGAAMTSQEKVGALLFFADMLEDRFGSSEYMPPEARDMLLGLAGSWGKVDDYVRMKWRQHLRRTWGPIETELI